MASSLLQVAQIHFICVNVLYYKAISHEVFVKWPFVKLLKMETLG
jgi:hypothetical protein